MKRKTRLTKSACEAEDKISELNRSRWLFMGMCFLAGLIIFRISWLAFTPAAKELNNSVVAKRGVISDERGNILAISEDRFNIFFDGRKVFLKKDSPIISELSQWLKLDPSIFKKSFEAKKVILLKRFVTRSLAVELERVGKQFVLVQAVQKRIYPEKKSLAQTIGFVGYDEKGLAGLELFYDDLLKNKGNPEQEKHIQLNINIYLQELLELKLDKVIKEKQAKSGVVLIQEVKTGNMVAMVQNNLFDLNKFNQQKKTVYRNFSVNSIIEPGSIFKIFFIAYILDKYNIDVNKKIYNCKGSYRLPNDEVIKDSHPHGLVSVRDIIKYSCNAGMIHLTERLSKSDMRNFLKKLRVDAKTEIDLPGESKGILPPLKEWGLRTKATIPIGQGIAITPINLINGFTSLINKGYLYVPNVAKSIVTYQSGEKLKEELIEPKVLDTVIREETSRQVVDLLVYGTIKGSTGYASRSTGFERVFGKTGTSQLANLKKGGYYIDRYHSIFAGGYPSSDPLYSILVIVSEPKSEYYGGKVAAPLFAEVLEELIRFYQLPQERVVERVKDDLVAGNYDQVINKNLEEIVPDFRGLSFRSAVKLLEDFKKVQAQKKKKVVYQIEGSGYVVEQSPKVGVKIERVVDAIGDVRVTLKLK